MFETLNTISGRFVRLFQVHLRRFMLISVCICFLLSSGDFHQNSTILLAQTANRSLRKDGSGWKEKWTGPWSGEANVSDYFDDEKTVALCNAICSQDFDEVSMLVKNGADVKAVGKSGMTPLMWCMPMTDNGIFELLLRSGADPNVPVHASFAGSPMSEGDCVTNQVALFAEADTLGLVLDFGC